MKKILFRAAVLMFVGVGLAQAQSKIYLNSIQINTTTHILMLNDNRIWLEEGSTPLMIGKDTVSLYLDETNPVFFALVYNALKDHMINKKSCWLFTYPSTVHTNNAKVMQIQFK